MRGRLVFVRTVLGRAVLLIAVRLAREREAVYRAAVRAAAAPRAAVREAAPVDAVVDRAWVGTREMGAFVASRLGVCVGDEERESEGDRFGGELCRQHLGGLMKRERREIERTHQALAQLVDLVEVGVVTAGCGAAVLGALVQRGTGALVVRGAPDGSAGGGEGGGFGRDGDGHLCREEEGEDGEAHDGCFVRLDVLEGVEDGRWCCEGRFI